jgi:tRNA A-37 threonylcarbamoyl transferase component Bud32
MGKFILFFTLVLFSIDGKTISGLLSREKILVKIGDRVAVLNKGTSCKSKYWNNTSLNSCKCCLIKKSLGNKDAEMAVRLCVTKKRCSPEIIETLQTTYGEKEPFRLLQAIVEEARLVQPSKISSKKGYHPQKQGQASEQGIQLMLLSLAENKKIKDSLYTVLNCFQVKSFSETNTGMFSSQLFGVFQDDACSEHHTPFDSSKRRLRYIIKEVAKGTTELKRIARLKASPLGEYNLLNPARPPLFPAIAFDEVSSFYKDKKGKIHYMMVLTAAPGKPFFDLIKNFNELSRKEEISTTEIRKVEKAYRSFGMALGLLHSSYMTKDSKGKLTGKSHAVHGDLHAHNVFVQSSKEKEDDLITLIDVETMAHALKKAQDVAQDLRKFYIFTARSLPTQGLQKKFTPNRSIDQGLWHDITMKPFLEAYVDAYAMDKAGHVDVKRLKEVIEILNRSYLSIFGSTKQLGFIALVGVHNFMKAQKKFLRPIIEEIAKKRGLS